MLRLNTLICLVFLALSGCIESPPPASQPVFVPDMSPDVDPDAQPDIGGDSDVGPDLPDPDGPACTEFEGCGEGEVCNVDTSDPLLNECVRCLVNEDCGMGVCTEDNQCVQCVQDSDCGDPNLTCSDSNTCIGCKEGGTCSGMADRCDPESEGAGTCVECLGDGNDTLCGEGETCDTESKRCVPCLPEDESSGAEDTCETGRCRVISDDSTENSCVECLGSEDCPSGGCDPSTNQCVTCVDDADCTGDFVCTDEADFSLRTCVPCLAGTCAVGTVCKTDTDPAQNLCVECLSNDHCSNNEVCDPSINECVVCLNDLHCPGDSQCLIDNADSRQNTCVTCTTNEGCQNPSASLCDVGANSCGVCQFANDCGHLPDTYNYCNGGCIQCYGYSEATDCPGTYCDLSTNMCSSVPVPTSPTPNLSPCNSSDECAANSRCMPLEFNGSGWGSYCMPLADPDDLCPRGPDEGYFEKVSRAPVEGGVDVLFCRLREQSVTPQAVVESGQPCGASSPCMALGSSCQVKDNSTNRTCGYVCGTDVECKSGFTCRCPIEGTCVNNSVKYCLPP